MGARFLAVFALSLALPPLLSTGCSDEPSGAAADTAAVDGGAETEVAKSGTLTVLTYNVHGLPPAVTGDDTAARLKAIGPRLKDLDIVGLQENFDGKNHATLAAGAGHPHVSRFDAIKKDGTPKAYGSGLAVLSKSAIIAEESAHYAGCHGLVDSASDCLASKGWQMARIRVGKDATIDVYNTHLEAGGGDEDEKVRAAQVDEVLAAIDKHSKGRAVLFTGDFNLHADDKPDQPLLAKLEAALTDGCQAVKCGHPKHIDRVFLRDGDTVGLTAKAWKNLSADFKDDKGVDLSDHPPLRLTVEWALK